jgi:KduI/IolB family
MSKNEDYDELEALARRGRWLAISTVAKSGAGHVGLDVAIPVQHGDGVLIHEGCHPVVKAPGTNAYYLNFLAGDVRKISAVNDPLYDWVSKNWEGNPIEIPLKS